jgi:hypothetical protein
MRLRIKDDKIELDGIDISNHIAGLEFNMTPTDGSTVALTLVDMKLDVQLEAQLMKMEKKNHTRFESLNGVTKFVRNSS